jgi:hypothetical protein
MVKIFFKTILHLGIVIVLGFSILLNFKIFQRIDEIQPSYDEMYDKIADHSVYQQIPTELQIELEKVDGGLQMLHIVSGESSITFGVLMGICVVVILINLVLEIVKDVTKLKSIKQSRLTHVAQHKI